MFPQVVGKLNTRPSSGVSVKMSVACSSETSVSIFDSVVSHFGRQ